MLAKTLLPALLLGTLGLSPVLAAEGPNLDRLQGLLGGEMPDQVTSTAVEGLYEVTFGSQVLYLSEDGRFVVRGELLDLEQGANLTEGRRAELRTAALDAMGEKQMIVYKPKGETKHLVTVFTDIDCPYCVRFHQEMDQHLANGIEVRYLLYPRAGIGSASYDKAVSAWCADDPQQALTQAKQGQSIEQLSCPNPVAEQFQLGQQLGVRGTPTIVLENGQLLPGYVPAPRLAQMLERDQ